MLVYYWLSVTAPNFLFSIRITTGRILRATLLLFRLHSLLEPFLDQGLDSGRKISHLLVVPLFEGLLCFWGLICSRDYRVAILVVLAILIGVVSQMRAALTLAMLAELLRPCFLWDLLIGVPRCGTLLETSLGASGSRWRFLCLCLETCLVLQSWYAW